ncbi:MAG: hypothetical protein IJV14_15440 [Lachnospiraceae bacterium]|nr:hypothetical protein [Lachnospiraceae bacterium]
MAIAEERLPVSDLTQLSSVVADDMLLTQTSGSNGDVMLTPISEIVSRILEPLFAQLDSPALTGEPTAPSITDNTAEDDRIATTAFVQLIAALKASTASPEFTGQAHFADHVPTTETGEGETVALATAEDIQNLANSISDLSTAISELTGSLGALNTALTGLVMVKTYTYAYTNLAANGYLQVTGTMFKIATPAGYTPIAVRRVTTGNVVCEISAFLGSVTGSVTALNIKNTASSAVSGTASIEIMYVKSSYVKA